MPDGWFGCRFANNVLKLEEGATGVKRHSMFGTRLGCGVEDRLALFRR